MNTTFTSRNLRSAKCIMEKYESIGRERNAITRGNFSIFSQQTEKLWNFTIRPRQLVVHANTPETKREKKPMRILRAIHFSPNSRPRAQIYMEIRWGTKPRIAKALVFATSHTLDSRITPRALCVCVLCFICVYFDVCIFVGTLSRLCPDKSIFR